MLGTKWVVISSYFYQGNLFLAFIIHWFSSVEPGGWHLTLSLRESLDNCRCRKSDRPDKSHVLAGVSKNNFLHRPPYCRNRKGLKKKRFHSFTSQLQATHLEGVRAMEKRASQPMAQKENGFVTVPFKTGDENRRCI